MGIIQDTMKNFRPGYIVERDTTGIDTDKNILMKVYTTEYKSKDCTIYSRASNPDDAVDSFRHYIGGNPGIVLVHNGPINPNEIFIQNRYLVGDTPIIASSYSEARAEGVRMGGAEYGGTAVTCLGPYTEIVDGRPVIIRVPEIPKDIVLLDSVVGADEVKIHSGKAIALGTWCAQTIHHPDFKVLYCQLNDDQSDKYPMRASWAYFKYVHDKAQAMALLPKEPEARPKDMGTPIDDDSRDSMLMKQGQDNLKSLLPQEPDPNAIAAERLAKQKKFNDVLGVIDPDPSVTLAALAYQHTTEVCVKNLEKFLAEPVPQGHTPEGTKYDGEKPRLDLVLGDFSRALLEVGKVGTFGAKKYEDHNWLLVKEGKERYSNALLRHYLESKDNPIDRETGLLHLAHLAWNALAILELSLRENDNAL